MVYSQGGVPTETTYYVGNYEKIVAENGTFKEYDYIYTPDGLSAIAIETNGSNTPEYYYINSRSRGRVVRVNKEKSMNNIRSNYFDIIAHGLQFRASGVFFVFRGTICFFLFVFFLPSSPALWK